MGNDRRPSPSDELVGRARADVQGDGTAPGTFQPTSPADSYYTERGDEFDDARPSGDAALDAASIAAELLEAGQIDGADTEPEPAEEPATDAGASSLPSWALDSPSAPTPDSAIPSMAQAPSAPPVPPAAASPAPDAPVDWDAPAGFDDVVAGEADPWSTPTTEWERRQAERMAKQQRRFDIPVPGLRSLVSLGVFAFFAIGFIVSLVDGREPIADAAVGDCFIVGEALEIEEVEVVACSEPHDSELYARIDMVPAFGTSFPGEDPAFDWLFEECLERFPNYTGESYEESRYWIDMFIPTIEAWDDGDYVGMCTLVVVDEDLNIVTSTGSGRGSPDNA